MARTTPPEAQAGQTGWHPVRGRGTNLGTKSAP